MSWCSRSAEPRGQAALLEVSGLTKSFGPLTVLREVGSRVGPGEIVAAAGGTGAVTFTLIGAIAGVLEADAAASLGVAETARVEPILREAREAAGTGLGLPIARGIVEAHGGTLMVAPADPGASFVVALPADPPPDPRLAAAGEPSGASWSVVEEPEEQRGG